MKVQRQVCVSDWPKKITSKAKWNTYIYSSVWLILDRQIGNTKQTLLEKWKTERQSKIVGMLTLANIISHYRASASPLRVQSVLFEHGSILPPWWDGGHSQAYEQMDGQELWGQKGRHSSLEWSLGTGFANVFMTVRECINLCTKGGIYPCAAYCMRGCVDGMKSSVKEEDQ